MSTSQRIKLSKKLFMSLRPGQYIMDNFVPQRYEEIGQNLESQWERWRGINGRMVTICESQTDCLREWLASAATASLRSQDKAVYYGKLDKKLFMESPNGYYLLFTQEPFDHLELQHDREEQWSHYKDRNGLSVQIFKNRKDCVTT